MTGEQASIPHFGSKIGISSPCIENALYEDDSTYFRCPNHNKDLINFQVDPLCFNCLYLNI